ncbi:MAG TPA: cytochrome P450 [Caulobacteraceae bacterium]|jgi:cytochrome P450|nr:cytochrome P450 [Caulobacteraceae bacterium]
MPDGDIDLSDGAINLNDGLARLGKDAFLARLHGEAPLFRQSNGNWVASRFDDVRAILLDHARFSSAGMEGQLRMPLLNDDPPRHALLRGLLAKAFTPAAMEGMRPAITQLAHGLVADIPTGVEVDIVGALTTPLPVTVIAGMMGVTADRHGDFKRWSNVIVQLTYEQLDAGHTASLLELQGYFAGLAAERRLAPGEDLVSALTKAREHSDALNDEQVVGFCMLLMLAGNETTTNLLGNLLNRLADAPEAWAALRADPARIDGAIEESLRIDSPAQLLLRKATQDATVCGRTIRAGENVVVYLAASNRDPARWQGAEAFEAGREIGRHLAFGHGVHSCIGAPLARIEARAAMEALVARFSTVRRGAAPGERVPGELFFGFRDLSLIFD